MQSSYNSWRVVIWFAVAMLASYTALDPTGRIFLLVSASQRHAWRLCGTAQGANAARLATSVILFTFAILVVTLILSTSSSR
jgi:NO-binding membrane sensor protein with MHYT domain